MPWTGWSNDHGAGPSLPRAVCAARMIWPGWGRWVSGACWSRPRSMMDGSPPPLSLASSAEEYGRPRIGRPLLPSGREGVLRLVRLLRDFARRRLAGDRTLDREFRRFVVIL